MAGFGFRMKDLEDPKYIEECERLARSRARGSSTQQAKAFAQLVLAERAVAQAFGSSSSRVSRVPAVAALPLEDAPASVDPLVPVPVTPGVSVPPVSGPSLPPGVGSFAVAAAFALVVRSCPGALACLLPLVRFSALCRCRLSAAPPHASCQLVCQRPRLGSSLDLICSLAVGCIY